MQPKFNSRDIKIIIGLGNPGESYENTYHNVGIMVVDYLKNKEGLTLKKHQYFNSWELSGIKLIEPSVFFMNDSSGTATVVMKEYKVTDPGRYLIIHDDSDLNIGRHDFAFGGGSAGHKGIESLIRMFKTENFWRLRIGIRDPSEKKRKKAGEFVLRRVKLKHRKILEDVFERIRNQLV